MMETVSSFLASLDAVPLAKRTVKAAKQLESLVFEPFSEKHVIAMALCQELSEVYSQVQETEGILSTPHGQTRAHESLCRHLSGLSLASDATSLSTSERRYLLDYWAQKVTQLPEPFAAVVQAFLDGLGVEVEGVGGVADIKTPHG